MVRAIVLILCIAPYSLGDDLTKANALLMKANGQALVLPMPPAGLHMSGRFKVYRLQHGDDTAVFEADYLDPRHFRTKYEMTGFQTIVVRNERQVAERQNTDFAPLRIRQIQRHLTSTVYFDNSDVIKKVFAKQLDGQAAHCIDFETIHGRPHEVPTSEICIGDNPAVMLLRSDGRFEAHWSNFDQIYGKYYPRHVVLKDNGEKIIEGDLAATPAKPFTAATFAAPPGFDIRKACEVRTPPVWVKGDEPGFPLGMRGGSGITENVMAQLKLGADGKIQKWALIEIAEPALNDAVQRVIPTWLFEPAKCDGQPVPFDMDFQINFHR